MLGIVCVDRVLLRGMEICRVNGGERTVKKLRLSKALTVPEGTTVSDACRRMAARRVDAVLLTDANGLLSGILTDKVVHFVTFTFAEPQIFIMVIEICVRTRTGYFH